MSVTAIVGAQWGDEGKGKITDLLAQSADVVIRFGGGNNAGHTVINDRGEFRLHLIPSGIFNPGAIALLGTGTVVDLAALGEELDLLIQAGVDIKGLRISERAQLIMPYHIELDRVLDEARGEQAIGTTRRGVGPAYADKAARLGIQAGDILHPDLVRDKLNLLLPEKNRILESFGLQPRLMDTTIADVKTWAERFGPMLVDQVTLLDEYLGTGADILLEGQLGAMRDLDWGEYPYVTSSTTIAGGGAVGGGIPPSMITRVVGVVKAYATAVGAGPFPTEIYGTDADVLRNKGGEFGATTGRPRRVGWFDAVAARYARMLNGFTNIALTKLDVLDGLQELRIATSYVVGERSFDTVPITPLLARAVPQYEELDGWQQDTSHAKRWDDLPPEARRYIQRVEQLVGARASLISVGPHRDQTIER